MNNPKIIIIIVTFNAMQWASRCLNSLKINSLISDTIIIDNGSTDGTQDYIKKEFPEAIFVQSQKNLGFGAANNIGFKYALEHDYDFVYLLNQDAWILPNCINEIIKISELYPNFGIISPMQYSRKENFLDVAFGRIFNKYNTENIDLITVPYVMAAHWLIPISALKKVGGFSPTFFHYGEDYNYIDRMNYHGFKVGIAKNAIGIHDRYERPISQEKQFYLKDVAILIRLSNPKGNFFNILLKTIFLSLGMSLNNFSIKPLQGFVKHMINIKSIYYHRQCSKVIRAFL